MPLPDAPAVAASRPPSGAARVLRALAAGAVVLSILTVTPASGDAPAPPKAPFADLLSAAAGVPGPFSPLAPTAGAAGAPGAPGPPGATTPGNRPTGRSLSEPGTITTIAGGECDGLRATEATIDPGRVAVDSAGRVFWVDQLWGQRHKTSVLLRTVQDGRVRTLAALFDRADGPYWRGIPGLNDLFTDIAPDGRGGLFYTYTLGSEEWARSAGAYPLFGYVGHVDADGNRTVVVGAPPGATTGLAPDRAGDGAEPLATHYDRIAALALDADANIYFVADNRVWVYNRGRTPLVFYAGTSNERRVPPGRVALLTGWKQPDSLSFASNDVSTSAGFFMARDLAVDAERGIHVLLSNGVNGGRVDAINTGGEARTMLGVPAPAGRVVTVAGAPNQSYGYTPDGAPALGALFGHAFYWEYGAVAVTARGDLLLTDTHNHAVRRVDATTGLLSTAAGVPMPGGTPNGYTPLPDSGGFNGDGRPARETLLRRPMGVTADASGRVVFADWNNQRIRRVESSGVVRTIVGRGDDAPCGDGGQAAPAGDYGGPFLGLPVDVAEDSKGNRYVSDGMWRTVRRIDPRGRITTVVGVPVPCRARANSTQGAVPLTYSEPQCKLGNHYGDGGAPERAGLQGPSWLKTDSYDNLYVVDVDRLKYVNFSDRTVHVVGHAVPPRTIVTLYQSTSQTFDVSIAPQVPEHPAIEVETLLLRVTIGLGDMDIDGLGNVFLADTINHQVLVLGACGGVERIAGNGRAPRPDNGDGGAATEAGLTPHTVAFDRERKVLYVTSSGESSGAKGFLVRAVNLSEKPVLAVGTAVEPRRIVTITGHGQSVRPGGDWGDGGRARDAVVYFPWGMVADRGKLYVADWIYRVRVIDSSGTIGTVLGRPYFTRREGFTGASQLRLTGSWGDGGSTLHAGVDVPGGMTLTRDGSLLVTSVADGRVRRIEDVRAVEPRHYPDRLLPGLGGADRLFDAVGRPVADAASWFGSPVALSPPGRSHAEPQLVRAPDGTWIVVANRGVKGRGCDVWRVAAPPGRVPAATPVPVRSEESLDGITCSVAARGNGLALAQGVVEPEVPTVTNDNPLVVSAGAGTAGGVDMLPGPATAGAPIGSERAWVAATGDGYVLAYEDASGIRIARSPDGLAYVPGASIGVRPARLGPVVAAGDTSYLGFAVDVGGVPEIRVARSTDAGRTWTTSVVARTSGRTGAESAPVVAVDRAGTAYVVWGVDGHVWLSSSRDGDRWGAPARVDRGMTRAVLPWVAAGDAGHVQVVWYGNAVDDLDAVGEPQWRVYFAHRPSGTQGLAVPTVVHHGAVCTAAWATCRRSGDLTSNLGSVLTVATGADGAAVVAFTEGPERFTTGDGGTGRQQLVSFTRQCRGSGLLAGRMPGGCAPSNERDDLTIGPHEKIEYVPDLPDVPVVPLPGLLPCSPLPPADPPAPADPAPAPETPRREDPRPGLVRVPPVFPPPVPQAPVARVPAPGQAPANQVQVNPNLNPQVQVNPMVGLGSEPDEQEQGAFEYATNRWDDEDALRLLGAGALLAMSAGWALRRRRAAEVALAQNRGGRPR